jgi:hypothetical protein
MYDVSGELTASIILTILMMEAKSVSAKLYGATSQKTAIFTLTATRISNLRKSDSIENKFNSKSYLSIK